MKPIKKPELRILKKTAEQEPPQQLDLPLDAFTDTLVVEPQPEQDEPAPEYYPYVSPAPDYPLTGSVGNSGWQVSDIWRDLRIDGFCD
ncbi:hypothetical protein [Nostoc sp. MS1]|uniref:hypothetical protein n=1 Tax=Nostoc sp. MS1 TaxID=2764711 RepID=UPI001CC53CF8|nr:hypothetical protein [Nostoc sp. MS1]BCL39645.1 hypothetical protein NSMS1_60920 [Nostoc sp. MS1]